ncbi:MAG: hypothetical protein JWO92_2523 [Chitinophagaceae bacterium]|nr:hypothetical protein [Chitinophagaceae bacterium]
MTTEELLKPGYKVIADYPLSSKYFNVGEVLIWSNEGFYYADNCKMHKETVEKYPHLFKKLEWHEERKKEDMPEYVKVVPVKKNP